MSDTPRNFSAALESLDRLAAQDREAAAAGAAPTPKSRPSTPVPAMRLLDHEPAVEAQARREGEALLGAMRRANVATGNEWTSVGLLSGDER